MALLGMKTSALQQLSSGHKVKRQDQNDFM